jgi:hypothetical protein
MLCVRVLKTSDLSSGWPPEPTKIISATEDQILTLSGDPSSRTELTLYQNNYTFNIVSNLGVHYFTPGLSS